MKVVLKIDCWHKFNKNLNLDYVSWEVNTLFIGTFNPGCCNEENSAEWFYGRTERNMFWNTLGYIYEQNPLLGTEGNPDDWKSFCERNKLAVTDLLKRVNKVVAKDLKETLCKNFSDSKLEPFILQDNVLPTEISNLIEQSSNLQNLKCVYLTRATTNRAWNILWKPIADVCRKRKIHVAKLTTPGGFNYFQFNENFPRTPENLAELWEAKGFKKCN
ncbi:hypothetical protein [Winogradskyella sp. PC D3.3]